MKKYNSKLPYKGSIEGFVINYINQNFWRVGEITSKEDLIQESLYIYYKCKNKYKKIWNENAKWFFSLFKSSFINYFHGLSVKNTEKMDNEICIDVEENYEEFISIYAINRQDYNEGYLLVLIEQAPEEVGAVLSLLFNAPKELLEEVGIAWRLRGKRKVQQNEHLCNLLGYNSDSVNLLDAVFNWFNSKD